MRAMLALGSLAAFLSTPLLLIAFQDGPLPALTGGFGEPTCLKCHFDNAPNDVGGALRLEGVPKSYIPGREYTITITVERSGLTRSGFEMAARFADGAQAGRLRAADPRTRVIYGSEAQVQYIQHTKAGSEMATPGVARWIVLWTAPDRAASAVTFHLAANASDADASPLGDYIYLAEAASGR